MSQSVSLSTVQNWEKDVDSFREWLRYDQSGGKVTRIFCELCHEHRDRLRAIRNFNSAIIDGETGSALKKDNVAKHKKTPNINCYTMCSSCYSSCILHRKIAT